MLTPINIPVLPEKPVVSVLIASYNYATYLGDALDSVLAQTYSHFEVIICDDGSTDASPQIAAHHARHDHRIRLICKDNGGVASALNKAYEASAGSVVCLLDADDLFAPEKLEHMIAFMHRHPSVGFGQHALQCIDGAGRALHVLPFAGVHEAGWIAERLRARGGRWRSLPTSALFFHRTLGEYLFPLPEAEFKSEADAYIVALAPLLTEVGYLPSVLASYRLHGQNLTNAGWRNRAATRRMLGALRRVNRAVNVRASSLRLGEDVYALKDHLTYREQVLTLSLIEGMPLTGILHEYLAYARAILDDDIYAYIRKVWGLFTFGIAMLLPVKVRVAWISSVHKALPLRRLLARLLR